jgi:hypothetical protein
MKELVQYFVDGTEVDFKKMLSFGLICPAGGGYVLTDFGKSFLSK